MTTHRDRMRGLEVVLKPHRGEPGQKPSLKEFRRSVPKSARKQIKQRAKKVQAAVVATLANGAGLVADQQLRHFFQEYNSRVARFGIESLPSSFNVLEAFITWDEDLLFFRLRTERDHLFSFSDFVDFVTSPEAPTDPFQTAFRYEDGRIYSYSLYDDPHDLIFSSASGGEFGIGGVSLVRHGNEISMMLLAGEMADLETESSRIPDFEHADLIHRRPYIHAAPEYQPRAEPLGSHADLWKTIVLMRFDIQRRSEKVRYVLRDAGDHFSIIMDDPESFRDLMKEARDTRLEELRPGLMRYAVLFEICKTAILLHAYFDFKLTLIKEEVVGGGKSAMPRAALDSARGPRKKKFSYGSRVIYRTVSALRIIDPSRPRAIRRFTAPRFRVDVDGFWRRLDDGQIGKGPNGKPVEGRTWVREHVRWRNRPEKPIEVLVKSRVSIARATVEAEVLAQQVAKGKYPAAEQPTATEVANRSNIAVSREEAYRQRVLLTTRLRWSLFQRDDFRCRTCGADAAADKSVRLDVDHIVPVSRGGKTEPANLRTLCSRCNHGKGDLIS